MEDTYLDDDEDDDDGVFDYGDGSTNPTRVRSILSVVHEYSHIIHI
jgi:hypothetical protein